MTWMSASFHRVAASTALPPLGRELAAAVLMAECAYVDGEFAEEEREAVWRAVRDEFALDDETADSLVEVAERQESEMWVDRPFSEMVKKHFNRDEQLALIRRLWEVALADGIVHPLEERFIARIVRALDVSDEALAAIRRKSCQWMRAGESRGNDDGMRGFSRRGRSPRAPHECPNHRPSAVRADWRGWR